MEWVLKTSAEYPSQSWCILWHLSIITLYNLDKIPRRLFLGTGTDPWVEQVKCGVTSGVTRATAILQSPPVPWKLLLFLYVVISSSELCWNSPAAREMFGAWQNTKHFFLALSIFSCFPFCTACLFGVKLSPCVSNPFAWFSTAWFSLRLSEVPKFWIFCFRRRTRHLSTG